MKTLLIPTLAMMGGLILGHSYQKQLTFTDHNGLIMKCGDVRSQSLDKTTWDVNMVKRVEVDSTKQGLTLKADTMKIHAIPESATSKALVLQHAIATGNVKIDKLVTGASGRQVTHIEGTQADFTSSKHESVMKMAGPVTIQSLDGSSRETMLAKGASGEATLEPQTKTSLESGLRKAKMDGNVRMKLTQYDQKSEKLLTTIHTTSDHMLFERLGQNKKITLKGSVHIVIDGDREMSGANIAVVIIDKNGGYTFDTGGSK